MKQVEIKDFGRGLVTNIRSEQMANNEFPLLKNWDFETRNTLSRRLGYESIKPGAIPAGKLQGYYEFYARPYRAKSMAKLFDFTTHMSPLGTDPVQKFKILAVSGKIHILEVESVEHGTQAVTADTDYFVPENYGWTETVVAEATNSSVQLGVNSVGQLEINLGLLGPAGV